MSDARKAAARWFKAGLVVQGLAQTGAQAGAPAARPEPGPRGEEPVKMCQSRYAVSLSVLLASATPAWAQETFGDPAGSGPIVSAVRWMQGTLLGTLATVVAVIAVAVVGLMMLSGRINWRFGATVILGCFILFGAASIVAGIKSTAGIG